MLQRLSFVILLALLVTGSGMLWAQTAPDAENYAPQPAFAAYSCQFLAESNQVAIQAVMMGGNGTAIPADDYSLRVTVGGEVLPASDYRVDVVPQRDPLQMILVLDTTDTVPIAEIVDALITDLIPRLRVEDEMALITFSQEIQPRTNFYTDKNRLVNEHILDLLTLEGDNRLYGAIQQAVLDFPVDSGVRRVVLVLTDSGRRESDITPLDAITSSARRNNVQIYPIGFYTRDLPRPDRADLVTLAAGTGGYAWVYEQPYRNRADVGDAVGGYLDEFVDALNSEIQVTVDLSALNTGSANLLALDLSADTANDAVLTTSITCPIQPLQHRIAFVDPLNNAAVQGAVQLGVIAQSDFSPEQTVVVFYQNGQVVQDTGSSLYTFDPATVAPGNYDIRAELVDRRGNILATTETITLYAQQVLELRLREGNADRLEGTVEFVLSGREGVVLPEASFSVAPVDDPQNVQSLGSVPFFTTGEAVLRVGDIRAELQRLFPDAEANTRYQISAQVTGISTSDPDPAVVANQLRFGLAVPVTQEVPVVVAETPVSLDWVPLVVGAVFLLINLILFIAVRRAWVRRLISHPDDSDFSPQMMSITVYREGMSQSFTLTKRTIFLGRGSTNDINLGGDARISRSHGVIMWRKGKWIYTNRKASLWVRIDGSKRSGFILQKLKPITEIEIGNALVVFHESAQQDVADFVKTDL